MKTVETKWLLENYRPGSRGNGWTWDDEERDLLSFPCLCNSPVVDGITKPDPENPCPTPGHYQLMLEDHLRDLGQINFPVLLGNDGRIWDGHHRVVAARRLGIAVIPVED